MDISVLVQRESLSTASDTSLLDFAESDDETVQQIAGGRGRVYSLLGSSFRLLATCAAVERWDQHSPECLAGQELGSPDLGLSHSHRIHLRRTLSQVPHCLFHRDPRRLFRYGLTFCLARSASLIWGKTSGF